MDRLWTEPSFQPYIDAFPSAHRTDPHTFLTHIRTLISADVKTAPLKNLQGYLWLSGYESGALRCPLFPDVLPALQKWRTVGLRILIYSSGSATAQKLLFQYTDVGDLRPLLSGYFDTQNAGPKTESSSYMRIVAESDMGVNDPQQWLFCSDRVEEVNAAEAAGIKAVVVAREGNAVLSDSERATCSVVETFAQLAISQPSDKGITDKGDTLA